MAAKNKNTPEIRRLAKKVKDAGDIEALANSPGGQQIVDNLVRDIISKWEQIGIGYKTMSHEELIAHIAEADVKYSLVRSVVTGEKEKKAYVAELKAEMTRVEEEEDEGSG